jgi:hypothetical protein
MQDKTKDLLKHIMENESKIPSLFWREVLWLQDSPRFGITRKTQLVWRDDSGPHETNWQNFFRKAKIKINDREIERRLFDYILLIKGNDLTAPEIIQCRNAQIRSHLLRDFGPERLVKELGAKVIHQDATSQLLHVTLGHQMEPLRLVKVKDSSTGDYYLLRVPPDMKTCKQAIAWTFNLDEDEYDPIVET